MDAFHSKTFVLVRTMNLSQPSLECKTAVKLRRASMFVLHSSSCARKGLKMVKKVQKNGETEFESIESLPGQIGRISLPRI